MGDCLNFDDHYLIGKEILGKGEFATVVKGLDVKNNQHIACKIVSKKKLNQNPKLADLFAQEIDVHRKLQSPFIVQLYKVYSVEDYYMLMMEFCEGGDLERYMKKRGPIPEQEAIGFFMQILAGFREIHSQSLILRDIKPSNIFIKGKTLKIADFGCARTKEIESQIEPKREGKTPDLLAPEIQEGQEYGFEVDIYSLGVLLYKMLFNAYPFNGSSKEVYKSMQSEDVDFHKNGVLISKQMIDFLKRLLKFDRNQRITWVQIYQHPIIAKNMKNESVSAEIILAPSKIDIQMYNDEKFSNKKFSSKQHVAHTQIVAEENKQKPISQQQYDEDKKKKQAELSEIILQDIITGIKQYVHRKNVYGILITLASSFKKLKELNVNYQIPAFFVQKKMKSLNQQLQKNVNERKNIFNMKFFNDFVMSEYYERIQHMVNEDANEIDKYLVSIQAEAKESIAKIKITDQDLINEINQIQLSPKFNHFFIDSLISYGEAMNNKLKNEKDASIKQVLFFHIVLVYEICSIDKAIIDNIEFDFEKHKHELLQTNSNNYQAIIEQKLAEALG